MKRLHVSLAVSDLAESQRFYSALFAAEPTVSKPDYAKWMLDDPRVNFVITTRGNAKGLDHLGIQVEDSEELGEVYGRLKSADRPVIEQGDTTCCYAQSEKSWIFDPEGVAWETFLTKGESPVYGDDTIFPDRTEDGCGKPSSPRATACCVPAEGEGGSA
jgi:catechol 2,3-dioxygenase-like lactoylglutathione lyase family enzyme